jgi:hypothetical protein
LERLVGEIGPETRVVSFGLPDGICTVGSELERSLELIATVGVLLSFVCVFLSLFRLKDCILALREPRSPISIE